MIMAAMRNLAEKVATYIRARLVRSSILDPALAELGGDHNPSPSQCDQFAGQRCF